LKTEFKVENPHNISLTLTLTLSLKEWVQLKGQLQPSHEWPARRLRDIIYDMTTQAEKHFAPAPVKEEMRSQ